MSTEAHAIDIVMPVRNGAKYIEAAIRSILSDSAVISKLIVIDDGSTDGTAAIIAGIVSSTEIRVISQAPLGLIPALNRGLEEATSEFVARMDADDISLEGRLSAQLDFLRRNPDIAAVGTQAEFIDEMGNPLTTRTAYPLEPDKIRQDLFERGFCVICHPTVLARREVLIAAGGYQEAFKHAEDYDLWLRLTDQHKIANLPEVFLQYRRHPDQVSNGRNIQQSFSRDFALWCARQRQACRPDPSTTLAEPPKLYQLNSFADDSSHTLANLALAYDAINKTSEGHIDLIPDQAFRAIRVLARKEYLGETRRKRYKLISWAAKTAFRRYKFVEAAVTFCFLFGCRLADSRSFRRLRRVLDNSRHSTRMAAPAN